MIMRNEAEEPDEIRMQRSEKRTQKSPGAEERMPDIDHALPNRTPQESTSGEESVRDGNRDIVKRLLDFATAVVKLSFKLSRNPQGRYFAIQLMRAATSAGANHREAKGAESRPDFAHKMQIALKELRETEFWLELVGNVGLVPADELKPLLLEVDELIGIFVASVVTAKSRQE
jgi:four helix bundle protein